MDHGTPAASPAASRPLQALPGDRVAARPSGQSVGLTSVVVACPNHPATRRCLAALFRHTDVPWELVAVTRCEGGPIAAYLEGLRDSGRVRVEVVAAPPGSGLRAAWALGLRAARGEYVALVRPTVVVTDAWLRQLVALAGASPRIGLVGPMSNAAPGRQASGPVSVESGDVAGLDAFAGRWRSARRGKWLTTDSVGGGCLLARRRLLAGGEGVRPVRAGGLRPRRLAARARRMGLEVAVALDLYVHDEARRADVEAPALPPLVPVAEGAGTAAPGTRARRVSLTMIVRDEEDNLPACLASAAGLFDEIVVVDTGSKDRTVELARAAGARVFSFPWVDDFAAARNAALGHATGDYAFWLDADDRVEPAEREKLRALFDRLEEPDRAYVVRCACDADPGGGGKTVVDHVRLFPLRGDVRWTYRVHEQILPALRKADVEVAWSGATVRHVGYNDPAVRARKLDRDRAILAREAAERPDDPFVLFNLGQLALERGDHRDAMGWLQRSLAGSAPTDSITRKLFALIAVCHQRMGETGAALEACRSGLASFPDDAELLFRRGIVHRLRGEPGEAEACWRGVLRLGRAERFSSLDEGIFGHVTRRNLARLAEERGDTGEADLQWRAVLAEHPGDAEASAALANLAVAAGVGVAR